jgi:hypothetical protein
VMGDHPIKQILLDAREYWDHPGTPWNIRENFLKIIRCGTIALGAEIYASSTESKLVYHTCKSRFCTSCGQRATEEWKEDLKATLPDVPYVEITLTMPAQFWPIIQENRHLLHGMPAMGAESIKLWANARHGVRVILMVVQHTFGGLLNFYPHLHVLVSVGGLREAEGRWISRLKYDEQALIELMHSWRFAVITYLAEALKRRAIGPELSGQQLQPLLEEQYERDWHVYVTSTMSKAHFVEYVGRYIRRPPVAEHRLKRETEESVQYVAKDTRNNRLVSMRFSNEKLIHILKQQVPDRGRHNMRYFGLLAPRAKARTWAAVFLLLKQKQRPHPPRLSWRWLRLKTFGTDPLQDSLGRPMHWVGRRAPVKAA